MMAALIAPIEIPAIAAAVSHVLNDATNTLSRGAKGVVQRFIH
jgi:hypothetical protein